MTTDRPSEASGRGPTLDPGSSASIGTLEAISIGVGGMIGGGIFAVLGLAVEVGQGGTFVAFALAGAVALLTATSYARLSVAFPSAGGTVAFLDEAFGRGRTVGAVNVLLWLSYIITTALYAFAFGSYGATFLPSSAAGWGTHVLITASVVAMAVLNATSAKLIGRAEDWIVAGKVLILVGFVVAGLARADLSASAPDQWPSAASLAAGGMLVFVAYEGFELIANSAADVRDPRRALPRALFASVGFTMAVYMAVAVAVVGLLSLQEVASASDFALAEAADVVWGQVGFDLIVVAALLSTASAINATLYGTARLSVVIAVDGEAPTALERRIADKPLVGLAITATAALLIANLVPLASISTAASAGFLIVFAAANLAAARLADRTGGRRWLSLVAAAACGGALIALIGHTATDRPGDLVLLAGLLLATYLGEATYQRRRTRRPLVTSHQEVVRATSPHWDRRGRRGPA